MRKFWMALTALAMVLTVAAAALAEEAAPAAPGEEPAAAEKPPVKDWPRFFGPFGNGIAPDTGLNHDWGARPPARLWQVALGDGGFAGPSVAGGKVYLIDHAGDQDLVRALSLEDGTEIWRHPYPETTEADNNGHARTTPCVADGKVYVLSRLGLLLCLNAENGEPIWSRDLVAEFAGKRPQWFYAGSPIVDGDRLIVCPGGPGASVVALNKATGETLWQGGGDDPAGYSTPMIAEILGVKQYVVFTAAALVGVAADSGQLLWRLPWKTAYGVNADTPLVAGNSVFGTSGYGHGCALVEITPQGPALSWESKEIAAHFNSPVAYNSLIFGIGDPGFLVCLDPATGTALWKQPGFEKGGVVAVDDTLLALAGDSGALVMVAATGQGYQELGRFTPLGGQSWTAPIVADGKLIVRNTQALACFDLR